MGVQRGEMGEIQVQRRKGGGKAGMWVQGRGNGYRERKRYREGKSEWLEEGKGVQGVRSGTGKRKMGKGGKGPQGGRNGHTGKEKEVNERGME